MHVATLATDSDAQFSRTLESLCQAPPGPTTTESPGQDPDLSILEF